MVEKLLQAAGAAHLPCLLRDPPARVPNGDPCGQRGAIQTPLDICPVPSEWSLYNVGRHRLTAMDLPLMESCGRGAVLSHLAVPTVAR
jgi:hypothetical protein